MTPEAFGVRPVVYFGSSWSPPWPPKAHQKDAKISPKSAFQPEGPHGVSQRAQKSKMNPKNAQNIELLDPCGAPLGAFGTHILRLGSFGGSCGIFGNLFGSLGGLVGSIMGFCGIPLGISLESLGSTGSAPQGAEPPWAAPTVDHL